MSESEQWPTNKEVESRMSRALEALSKGLGYMRAEWEVARIGKGPAEDDFASLGDEILEGRTIVDIEGRHERYRCMVTVRRRGHPEVLLTFSLYPRRGRTFELRMGGPDVDIGIDLNNIAASLPAARAAIATLEALRRRPS